ncbi:hypothetical protein Tco_1324601 [Tanacetum coccineum]
MAERTTKIFSPSMLMWQLSGIPCVHATKSMHSTVLPPKPKKMPGRPRKKIIRSMGEGGSSTRVSKDVDVVQRGPVRDEGAGGSRGGARGSRGRGCAARVRGGASGSRGGASVSRGVVGRSRGGPSVSGGASGSRGRGAGGSKRKHVSTARIQKRLGKKKTQDEDQVEQTQEQAEIDLTQVEKTQEQTQDQVHPQEQPQQAALRMPSARILKRKLRKQGSSQNTALNVE